jgi:type I restriction-modification system DNA methylase subunit
MFEQAFKNIDDVLWKEAGCTTELDYTEQTSWLLFLKYLDGLKQDKADEAALEGKKYTFILDKPYRWDTWAAPRGNTDNASVSLRKLLLESCSLHTVLDCPGGTFQGAGVKTVVLFFEKGTKTRKVWYYQLDPGRNLGKTNPLNDSDLAEFVELQKTFADSPKSWTVDAKSIDPATFDLSVKNPNGGEALVHRSPQDIMDEIAALDAESAAVLETIRGLL